MTFGVKAVERHGLSLSARSHLVTVWRLPRRHNSHSSSLTGSPLRARPFRIAAVLIVIASLLFLRGVTAADAPHVSAVELRSWPPRPTADGDLPPSVPPAPWQVLVESLLPYPIFYPAVATLNNSVWLLGGCVTETCATPVGDAQRQQQSHAASTPSPPLPAWRARSSPYHEHVIGVDLEKGVATVVSQLTVPPELGFAGRHAAVTLTDTVYVTRSCTMTTLSPAEVARLTTAELQALQVAHASIAAFYWAEIASTGAGRHENRHRAFSTPSPSTASSSSSPSAVNLSYFEVPLHRVRVNASCTVLAGGNRILIVGGFLLSTQRPTASVDAFDVVTQKYEIDLTFLSVPVLEPSVAASTGLAVVVGGWTTEPTTTTVRMGAVDSGSEREQSVAAEVTAHPHHTPPPSPFVEAAPLPSSTWEPVTRYLFDIFMFEPNGIAAREEKEGRGDDGENGGGDGLRCQSSPLALRGGERGGGRGGATSLCKASIDEAHLPADVVANIIRSPLGCHVEVFGGAVVLSDYSLDYLTVLDIHPTAMLYAKESQRSSHRPHSPLFPSSFSSDSTPLSHVQKDGKGSYSVEAQRLPAGAATAESSSSSSSSSSSGSNASSSSSSSFPPPPHEYRYAWQRPTLFTLPFPRPVSNTSDGSSAGSLLVFHALGGTDLWLERPAPTWDRAREPSLSGRRTPGKDGEATLGNSPVRWPSRPPLERNVVDKGAAATVEEAIQGKGQRDRLLRNSGGDGVVIRSTPARRWAQRMVPDPTHDAALPELLALLMPTPIWPDGLTLRPSSKGIIHLDFPNVNYTRQCGSTATSGAMRYPRSGAWGRRGVGVADNDDEVRCAVRLSSRRDCVGNSAGTLDSAYDGVPKATILFSVSGSTAPVYVCFGSVVQPTSWPPCPPQFSFSVLNPLMPLRIIDNNDPTTSTAPAPTPPATRDPADKTTSSPLFILVVGIAMVTMLVAVLLVARLQQVPEEGLFTRQHFGRHDDGGGSSARAPLLRRGFSTVDNGDGGVLSRGSALFGGREVERRRCRGNVAGAGESAYGDENFHSVTAEGGGRADGASGDSASTAGDAKEIRQDGAHPGKRALQQFLHIVDVVQEEQEMLMLAAAEEVLRLHQHRYRILSRIGRGPHSLCFLALRKSPPLPPPHVQAGWLQHPQPQLGDGAASGYRVQSLSGGAGAALTRRTPFEQLTLAFPGEELRLPATTAPSTHTLATPASSPSPFRPPPTAASALWAARYHHSAAVVVKYMQCPDDVTRATITRLCERLRDLETEVVTAARRKRTPHGSALPRMLPRVSPLTLPLPRDVPCAVSDRGLRSAAEQGQIITIAATSHREAQGPATVAALRPPPSAASTHHSDGDHNDDGTDVDDCGADSCAWLDVYEVNVVLSLFLLLPEDVFLSYALNVVSRLSPHAAPTPSSGRLPMASSDLPGGVLAYNLRFVWRSPQTMQDEERAPTNRLDQLHHHDGNSSKSPASFAAMGAWQRWDFLALDAPRVCWDACANLRCPSPLRPPWSLCLVMPYERAGDLFEFVQRRRLVLAQSTKTALLAGHDRPGTPLRCSPSSENAPPLTPLHHFWTESLLCALLFQLSTSLQLLHLQSPPIVHGNVTERNVLLRAPTTFSVSRRRVETLSDGNASGCYPYHRVRPEPTASSLPPSWRSAEAGSVGSCDRVFQAKATMEAAGRIGSPLRSTNLSGAALPLASSEGATVAQTPDPLEETLLSSLLYLPVSLADAGMSWWLSVQLPQRLRGCFGETTNATLRCTPAGRRWLRRYETTDLASTAVAIAVPDAESLASLAFFLFDFIEVPPHNAPEQVWGILCALTSDDKDDVGVKEVGPRVPATPSSISSHPSQEQSRRWEEGYAMDRPRRDPKSNSSSSNNNSNAPPRRLSTEKDLGTSQEAAAGPLYPSSSLSPPSPGGIQDGIDVGRGGTVGPSSPHEYHDTVPGWEAVERQEEGEEVQEDGIFTRDEVDALTSAMWKAEDLSRVASPHRRRGCEVGPHGAPPPTPDHVGGAVSLAARAGVASAAGAVRAAAGVESGADEQHECRPPPSLDTSGVLRGATAQVSTPSDITSVRQGIAQSTNVNICSSLLALTRPTAASQQVVNARRNAYGDSESGYHPDSGGSGGHSTAHAIIIKRVLAVNTSSDVWSLGLLLYSLGSDAPTGRPNADGSPSVSSHAPSLQDSTASRREAWRGSGTDGTGRPPTGWWACSSASRLAQRAFAALLGDLYDFAAGVRNDNADGHDKDEDGADARGGGAESCVPRGAVEPAPPLGLGCARDSSPCGEAASMEPHATPVHHDEGSHDADNDDRVRWPRSCALEDEVRQRTLEAGYSSALARLLARMLSPVAARRPCATELVERLRLVVEADPAAATVPRADGANDSSVQEGISGRRNRYATARPLGRPSGGRTVPAHSPSTAAAVLLDERTAHMALRRR